MKFYPLKEVPLGRDDKIFKASPAISFIALLISLAIQMSRKGFAKGI